MSGRTVSVELLKSPSLDHHKYLVHSIDVTHADWKNEGKINEDVGEKNRDDEIPSALSFNVPFHPRQRKKIIRFLFVCFFFIQVFVNYDSGTIPSVLEKIAAEFNLSDMMLGVLGALPFLGLIVAAPFAGALLQTMSPKTLLLISITTNIGSTVMLALSFNVYVLYIARFMEGVTSSGVFAYVPVWVDEFSELKYQTTWLGLIQGGTVIGITLGYLVTGYINPWRISAGIQAGVITILLVVFFFTPALYIDLYVPPTSSLKKRTSFASTTTDCPEKERLHPQSSASTSSTVNVAAVAPASATPETNFDNRDPTTVTPLPTAAILETMEISVRSDNRPILRRPSANSDTCIRKRVSGVDVEHHSSKNNRKWSAVQRIWLQFKLLFVSKIYIWTVFTLCALFFVVTAIQYWSTRYFIITTKLREDYIRLVFSVTAATAPVAGVLIGAFVVDKLGGYKSAKGMYRTLLLCLVSVLTAATAGMFAAFLQPFAAVIAMIWFFLFFAVAIFPAATGILIATVDPSVRPFASSFSMFSGNLLGYALGSFLPGVFMSRFGIQIGFKIIFFWTFLGVLGLSLALFFAWKDRSIPLEVSELVAMRRTYSNDFRRVEVCAIQDSAASGTIAEETPSKTTSS